MVAVLDILAFRSRQLIPVLAIAVLAGCTTTANRAPVVEHSSGATAAPPQQTLAAPPSGPGYYTVKSKDTLYAIALQFGLDYRQLAAWNNLDSSFHIHVDQVLRVSPPDTGNGSGSVAVPLASSSALVERPLGAPGPSAGTPPGYGPLPAAGDLPEKSGPSGVKRPYSDAALAELSKPDGDAGAPPAPAPVAVPAGEDAAGDDENVGWIWPASGPQIAAFSDTSKGINIAGKTGAPVLAAGAGQVIYVGNGVRGLGNLVVVKHNGTYISVYAHNSKILVVDQQPVKKGQKIAEMGDSDADQVELHFEIRRQGKPVDPMKFLPAR